MYLSESLHLYEVADYWRSIITMNDYQKQRFTKRIIACLFNNLRGKKIAVLGFAFKKDTSDTRESPAITLVRNFVNEKANVAIYDPRVKEQQIWKELADDGGDLDELVALVKVCPSAYAACLGADAAVVVTEWDEFSNKSNTSEPVVVASSTVLREVSPNRVLEPRSPPGSEKVGKYFPGKLPQGSYKEILDQYPTTSIEERLQSSERTIKTSTESRLDWARIATGMRKPSFVFDGRNILDASKLEKLGFRVEAIGRASNVSRNLHD